MPVLITGAAAAGAHRLQRTLGIPEVIFADQEDLPKALFNQTRFIQIPNGGSATFAHQLLTLCLDHSINMVFPLRRGELKPLSESKKLFEEYGIQIVIPDAEVLDALTHNSASVGEEIIVLNQGMVLSGQFLELSDLPAEAGLFICSGNNYTDMKLFIID
ncbi:MAG TPA: hypothetical protein VNI52_08470 [Sphingobacteriaceae bacterium]|nr:hypothetical protein [Sphingobacteriaceae bacterium]